MNIMSSAPHRAATISSKSGSSFKSRTISKRHGSKPPVDSCMRLPNGKTTEITINPIKPLNSTFSPRHHIPTFKITARQASDVEEPCKPVNVTRTQIFQHQTNYQSAPRGKSIECVRSNLAIGFAPPRASLDSRLTPRQGSTPCALQPTLGSPAPLTRPSSRPSATKQALGVTPVGSSREHGRRSELSNSSSPLPTLPKSKKSPLRPPSAGDTTPSRIRPPRSMESLKATASASLSRVSDIGRRPSLPLPSVSLVRQRSHSFRLPWLPRSSSTNKLRKMSLHPPSSMPSFTGSHGFIPTQVAPVPKLEVTPAISRPSSSRSRLGSLPRPIESQSEDTGTGTRKFSTSESSMEFPIRLESGEALIEMLECLIGSTSLESIVNVNKLRKGYGEQNQSLKPSLKRLSSFSRRPAKSSKTQEGDDSIPPVGFKEEIAVHHLGDSDQTLNGSRFTRQSSSETRHLQCPIVFGGQRHHLPKILVSVVEEIYSRGLNTPGLFQKPEDLTRVDDLIKAYHVHEAVTDQFQWAEEEIDTLSGVLKRFLHALPEPLLCGELFELLWIACVDPNSFLVLGTRTWSAAQMSLTQRRVSIAQCILRILPPAAFSLIIYLFAFMVQTTFFEANRLTPRLLGNIFGPLLFLTRDELRTSSDLRMGGFVEKKSQSHSQAVEAVIWMIDHWSLITHGLLAESFQLTHLPTDKPVKKQQHGQIHVDSHPRSTFDSSTPADDTRGQCRIRNFEPNANISGTTPAQLSPVTVNRGIMSDLREISPIPPTLASFGSESSLSSFTPGLTRPSNLTSRTGTRSKITEPGPKMTKTKKETSFIPSATPMVTSLSVRRRRVQSEARARTPVRRPKSSRIAEPEETKLFIVPHPQAAVPLDARLPFTPTAASLQTHEQQQIPTCDDNTSSQATRLREIQYHLGCGLPEDSPEPQVMSSIMDELTIREQNKEGSTQAALAYATWLSIELRVLRIEYDQVRVRMTQEEERFKEAMRERDMYREMLETVQRALGGI